MPVRRGRDTMLPAEFPKTDDYPAGIIQEDNLADKGKYTDLQAPATPSRGQNMLRKKVHGSQGGSVAPEPSSSKENRVSVDEVWYKYQQFWESDQAGIGIVAHDNTVDHNIVVIKSFKLHAGNRQCGLLRKVSKEKPSNIVCLLDVFPSDHSIHLAYESLEVSLHHIQATCLQEITEIELAIIAKEVLQGLRYIHSELQVPYGQLCPRNVLLSYYSCDVKLANIGEPILKPQKKDYADDARAVGTLLVRLKEPGTFRRNPESLELKDQRDISDHCKTFIRQTASSSLKHLINHDFLLKSPGIGRLRIFIYRAMACAAKFPSKKLDR
ncbi:hypothetical protein BDV29DRAFT_163446 [Aspergillus leporis]|uniref:Protein kinase domain-containing protein n=1 Tax=Aspergillus leporis TaxID=41062 RepID=A0A5N5WJM3_9EURO|nr:hypothetical protein BDV29DRAFT_163446 [Aspergillus leporis]